MERNFYDMEKEKGLLARMEEEPMMTAEEQNAFLERTENDGYLALWEDREYPLHDVFRLPKRWVSRENPHRFTGEARPGEWYAFQIALYCEGLTLGPVKIGWTGNFKEPTCINLQGTDCQGKKLEKTITVPEKRVQALWFGFDIPKDFTGTIEGALTVSPEGRAPTAFAVSISVSGSPLEDRGDSQPWRHSRLRWLNSKIALDDALTHPFIPLRVDGLTVIGLGHAVTLGADGLPLRAESLFTPSVEAVSLEGREILSSGVAFHLAGAGEGEILSPCRFTEVCDGVVRWEAKKRAGCFVITVRGSMEFDGYISYEAEVEAWEEAEVSDISLTLPYRADAAKYWMGLGERGGYRKKDLSWKWDVSKNQDTLWMGDVNAGLMLRLKDEHYEKPYMLIYYHYHPLVLPVCWDNQGKGGVRVQEEEDGVKLTAYSGCRRFEKGERVKFLFDLAMTPVKPINKEEHWRDHYYHAVPGSREEWKQVTRSGANIINVHHAHEQNPFINYPFFETEKLVKLVDEAHENGCRVKLYYTIKEMTVHMTEFFALQSLQGETFPSSWEIGKSFQGSVPYADEWMKRMIGENYMTAWRQKVTHGSYVDAMEASVVTNPMSRLNNYYLEGLRWLLEETGIDGLYFDDVAFDRSIMKRIRKILDRDHPRCSIDLHSWNYFENNTVDDTRPAGYGNSMNLYIDNFAFIDRIWFGEGFDYDVSPDGWLVEMSGIPFGMMGEMLQNGGNVFRGMVFGMTNRLPNEKDPSGIWALWKEFDIANAVMRGYWNPTCPAATSNPAVFATVYQKPDAVLIALGSWAPEDTEVDLELDFDALGFDKAKTVLETPEIPGFQKRQEFSLDQKIPVPAGGGWVMILREEA